MCWCYCECSSTISSANELHMVLFCSHKLFNFVGFTCAITFIDQSTFHGLECSQKGVWMNVQNVDIDMPLQTNEAWWILFNSNFNELRFQAECCHMRNELNETGWFRFVENRSLNIRRNKNLVCQRQAPQTSLCSFLLQTN